MLVPGREEEQVGSRGAVATWSGAVGSPKRWDALQVERNPS